MAKLHTSLKGDDKKKKAFDVLYEWTEDERMWSQKDRAWYISYTLFFLVIMAMAAIWRSYVFIVTIMAFMFLWFTQAAIPPEKITTRITTLGIKTYGKIFKWKNIKFFWFSFKGDVLFLNLDIVDEAFTSGHRVHRLALIIPNSEMVNIFEVLVDKIEYGDKTEVNYNIISRALHGTYIDITEFLGGENIEQEEYLASQGKSLVKEEESTEDLINE